MSDTATPAEAFKKAFHAAARDTLFADDASTLVAFGAPGPDAPDFDDWVVFLDVEAEQDVLTLAPVGSRSREETITQTVVISSFRKGDGEAMELAASDRAYAMLRSLERYVRVTDMTVGGTVEWCLLTRHRSAGETDKDEIKSGRLIEIEATFTALARVRG